MHHLKSLNLSLSVKKHFSYVQREGTVQTNGMKRTCHQLLYQVDEASLAVLVNRSHNDINLLIAKNACKKA